MKAIPLYFLLSMLTGNPILALVVLLLLYGFIDRLYFRFLPDFFAPLKRNSRIKNLQRLIYLNPSNADALLELGVLYFEKRRYDRCIEYLNRAGEKIENSARLYMYLGMASFEINNSSGGIKFLEKALELNPSVGYGLPYVYMLRYHLESGNSQKELFSKLEERFQSFANTENFFRMGKVYKNSGDRIKAKEMFEHALRDYTYCPRALRKLHRRWAFFSWLNKLTIGG